jgi:hypothetical protein
MPVKCPGAETYSHIFGVGRRGPNPAVAFLAALIVLIWEIANSDLRAFLQKKCGGKCVKTITGPNISNWVARLTPLAGGGWNCVLGVTIDARIDCQLPGVGPGLAANWGKIGQDFAGLLRDTESLDGPRRT